MKIKCTKCGYEEKTNKDLWIKIIGGTLPTGGFTAWVTYIFAGTGFALEIVTAMVVGGVAMLIYKDEILKWISSYYECPKCKNKNWDLIS